MPDEVRKIHEREIPEEAMSRLADGAGWPADEGAWKDASDLAKGPIVRVDVAIIGEDVMGNA